MAKVSYCTSLLVICVVCYRGDGQAVIVDEESADGNAIHLHSSIHTR